MHCGGHSLDLPVHLQPSGTPVTHLLAVNTQLEVVWLTLGAATRTGFGPALLHVEMECVSIVFNAIHNPGKEELGVKGVKRGEARVNVTEELFQLAQSQQKTQ